MCTVSTDYTQVNVYVHSVCKRCKVSTNYVLSTDYTSTHIRIHVYARIRTYLAWGVSQS